MGFFWIEIPQVLLGKPPVFSNRQELLKGVWRVYHGSELRALEETINRGIRDEEWRWIITFTEKEWRELIKSGPPSVDIVQGRLEKEFSRMKEETTSLARSEQKQLREDVVVESVPEGTGEKVTEEVEEEEKKEEVKWSWNYLRKKVEEIKERVQGSTKEKIHEITTKIESLKEMNPARLWMAVFGLGLSLWVLKFINWITFGFFSLDKKIEEMENDKKMMDAFRKDPVAAVKKYGSEALQKIKEKGEIEGEEIVESGKEKMGEVSGPLAAVMLTGGVLLSTLKTILPKPLWAKIDMKDTASALRSVSSWMNILKFFGKGGAALLGMSALFIFLESEKGKEVLASFPENAGEKRDWWKKVLVLAGVEDGDNLIEILVNKDGYENLNNESDDPTMYSLREASEDGIEIIEQFGTRVKNCILHNKATTFIVGSFFAELIGTDTLIKWAAKAWDFTLDIAKISTGAFVNHPIIGVCALVALIHEIPNILNIQVPRDPAEFPEYIAEVCRLPEMLALIEEFWKKHGINITADSLIQAAKDITNPEELRAKIDHLYEEGIAGGREWLNYIFASERALVKGRNVECIDHLIRLSDEHIVELARSIELLKQLREEMQKGELTQDQLVLRLDKIAENPHLSFQINKEYTDFIIKNDEWEIIDEWFLCTNLEDDIDKQYVTMNRYGGDLLSPFRNELQSEWRYLIDSFARFDTMGDKDKVDLIDRLLHGSSGLTLVYRTGKMYLEWAKQRYIIGTIEWFRAPFQLLKGKVGYQEFVADYADGLLSVMVFTAVTEVGWKIFQVNKAGWGTLGKRILFRWACYPISALWDTLKVAWKWAHYVGARIMGGDYKRILADTKGIFTARFYEKINKAQWALWFLRNGGQLQREIWLLYEAKKLLHQAKGTFDIFKQWKLERVHEILEWFWEGTIAKISKHTTSLDKLQEYIEEIETEIAHKERKLQDSTRAAMQEKWLKGVKKVFVGDGPALQDMRHRLGKITRSDSNKVESVISRLRTNNRWKNAFEMMGPAMFAGMAYDIGQSKDARETIGKYGGAMWVFYAGFWTGKLTMMSLGKGPVSTAVGVMAGLAACFVPGPTDWLTEKIQVEWDRLLAAWEFNSAVWKKWKDAYSMGNWFLTNRALLKTKMGLNMMRQVGEKLGLEAVVAAGTKKIWLEKLASKIGTSIEKNLVEKFIIRLSEKVGWVVAEKGAAAGGASFIPVAGWVVDVGLAAWTAYDVHEIFQMMDKARNMKEQSKKQNAKEIQDIQMKNQGESSIADLVRVHEQIDYFWLSKEEKNDRKFKYFEQVPRCDITITRIDGSSENYIYAAGNPTFAEIKDEHGTVLAVLTKDDLNQAEKWEASKDYKPEPINYTMNSDQLKLYYAVQVQKLKVSTKWQELDIRKPIESDSRIVVNRNWFSEDSIIMLRQGEVWTLHSEKKGNLHGSYDFHGALALAWLALYSLEFLTREVQKDAGWKSDNGTKTPFYQKGNAIKYSKDAFKNTEFISEKWMNFYVDVLRISPENIVGTLNAYFWLMSEELELIGN